ncbi:MAG: ABC transporter ATP-binding protein [Candidatus Dormibacteraeota bacterium]|nr:ABC transporter ATP-binding protein [Candidatus Dormibacteraeota bacterium]
MADRSQLLRVENLEVHYTTPRGVIRAVDGVSFDLAQGERFGLAGESGSGKSTAAQALMGLIRSPGHIVGGRVTLDGRPVLGLSDEHLRRLRLAEMAMVPQGAMNSLNPVRRVRDHFADSIRAHRARVGDREIRERMRELLGMVGLQRSVGDLFPHELSGGMKQRVCIALAITLEPKVIIADEPTSALDVVMQRQVMQTLRTIQERLGASVLLIGHDMGLLAQFVDRLGIMFGGRLVEVGPVRDIFHHPVHPYTRMVIESLPTLKERDPSRAARASGTRLRPSRTEVLQEAAPGHWVAVEEQAS